MYFIRIWDDYTMRLYRWLDTQTLSKSARPLQLRPVLGCSLRRWSIFICEDDLGENVNNRGLALTHSKRSFSRIRRRTRAMFPPDETLSCETRIWGWCNRVGVSWRKRCDFVIVWQHSNRIIQITKSGMFFKYAENDRQEDYMTGKHKVRWS